MEEIKKIDDFINLWLKEASYSDYYQVDTAVLSILCYRNIYWVARIYSDKKLYFLDKEGNWVCFEPRTISHLVAQNSLVFKSREEVIKAIKKEEEW